MASLIAFNAFQARLASWTATPIVYENTSHTLPNTRAAFVYVEIVGDMFDQDTIGAPENNQFVERGTTYLNVLVPAGSGSVGARGHADALLKLFREQPLATDEINGERIYMPEFSIGEGRPEREFASYWALTLTIRWYRRDTTDLTP